MATSKVIYSGELRTKAEHLASKNNIITDAPTDNHGKGEAFSPTDLAATSLASCMLTVLGIYAQNHNIIMDGSFAEVTKIMSQEGPRRIVGIDVNLTICSPRVLSEHEQIAIERVAKTCPVSLSLHPDLQQNILIQYQTQA